MKYIKTDVLRNVDWRSAAACLDEDPELFFPIGTTGPAQLQAEQARDICKGCPAIGYCALYALETGQDAGVWGGMTEDERRALRVASPNLDTIAFAQSLQDEYAQRNPGGVQLPSIIDLAIDAPKEQELSAPTVLQHFRA
jgi:WhiB family redox-sensing transcriptional regulator